jgi:hypothetical protein
LNLKKQVNETKTESELQVQYKERETDGSLACKSRLNDKEESWFETRI